MPTAVRRFRARLRSWRTVTVREGPARGLRISLRQASADYAAGDNERPVQDALARHLRPGDVFFDVGANVGFFTILAARLVGPTGRVVALEAVPRNARRVVANARRNGLGNVTVLALAAGAGTGTATLNLARHPGGAVLASAGVPPDASGTITVPVRSIDDLAASEDLPPPTVCKIDVEGAEEAVLDGMVHTLRTLRPVLVVEMDDGEAEVVARRASALADRLDAVGYDVEPLPGSYSGDGWHVAHTLALPRKPGITVSSAAQAAKVTA